jgi:hypothetical protein
MLQEKAGKRKHAPPAEDWAKGKGKEDARRQSDMANFAGSRAGKKITTCSSILRLI